jgi:DNA polymerase III subunit epsilon
MHRKLPSASPGEGANFGPTGSRPRFVALDFETADYGRDSACAVSMVVGEGIQLVSSTTHLIRPPRPEMVFSYLHGITWSQVEDKPTFGELWPELGKLLEGVDFVAAHNAGFDEGVMRACCQAAGIGMPRMRFVCTVRLARSLWKIFPTKLPDVCRQLDIPLRHHDPASDAMACARIVVEALKTGQRL